MRKLLSKACLVIGLASLNTAALALHDYPAAEFWLPSNQQNDASIDHSSWQQLLTTHLVTEHESGVNRVNYAQLAEKDSATLDAYLAEMAELDIRQYRRVEQFAYWVNLYNAITVKLVVDNYPVSSIKKIYGGWFNTGPWDEEVFNTQGQNLSLNDIEHRILRPIWQDHRIHFVVNCASIGCPNLMQTAMTADNQEELLNSAAQAFLQHPRGFTVTENNLVLSKIFKWYAGDFGANQASLLVTLTPYLNENQRQAIKPNSKISYQYDWALNDL